MLINKLKLKGIGITIFITKKTLLISLILETICQENVIFLISCIAYTIRMIHYQRRRMSYSEHDLSDKC
jgi:hypothetical protein